MLRRIHSYFIAIWTLPSGVVALIVPFLVAPMLKMLVSTSTEINGQVLTFSSQVVLPSVGYAVLLCSAWLSGLSANNNDFEFIRLTNLGQVRYYIIPPLTVNAFFAAIVSFVSLLVLIIGGANDFRDFPFLGTLSIVLEVVLLALLGCGLGLIVRNGILAVSVLFLYSLLLKPAIIRLLPLVESRGLGARLSELSSGVSCGTSFGLDFVFYGGACVVFFLYYALRVLRIEHAKF